MKKILLAFLFCGSNPLFLLILCWCKSGILGMFDIKTLEEKWNCVVLPCSVAIFLVVYAQCQKIVWHSR